MSKQRTRKSAAARFKISKKGKLTHRSHGIRHLKSNKSSRQIRSLNQPKLVEGKMEKKVKKMLGKA